MEHLKDNISVENHDTRENLSLVMSGKVDYAMISIVDYFRNKDQLQLVRGPTITGLGHSMSNLMISKQEGPHNGMRIGVTNQTETTAFFLRIVLDKTFPDSILVRSKHSDPSSLLEENDFALVIGDAALSVYSTSYRIIYDVTHMFSSLYSLYSIYAVTVKKNNSVAPEVFPADFRVSPWEKKKIASRMKLDIPSGILQRYYEVISYDYDSIIQGHLEKLEKLYFINSKRIFNSELS